MYVNVAENAELLVFFTFFMHLPLRASLRALSYNEDRNNYTLYRILPKTLDLGICPKVYNCSTGVSPL